MVTVVATAVVAVTFAVDLVSVGMILRVQIVGILCFLKRRSGHMDRPSYRDARTHLKMVEISGFFAE